MRKKIVKCVYLLSFYFLLSCNATLNKSPLVAEVERINGSLKMKEVKERFGEPKQGHGSYVWYKSGSREVWFWFLAKKDVNPDDLFIAFVTLVYPNNPEMNKLIWPDRLKNYDLKYIINSIKLVNQPPKENPKKTVP